MCWRDHTLNMCENKWEINDYPRVKQYFANIFASYYHSEMVWYSKCTCGYQFSNETFPIDLSFLFLLKFTIIVEELIQQWHIRNASRI